MFFSRRSGSAKPVSSVRRRVVGLLAAALLLSALGLWWTGSATRWTGSASAGAFSVAAMTRIGLVLGACWYAWDSLRRPAAWFPPGFALAGVVAIVAVAAQPRLILAAGPILGVLGVLAMVTRFFRRQ